MGRGMGENSKRRYKLGLIDLKKLLQTVMVMVTEKVTIKTPFAQLDPKQNIVNVMIHNEI